MFFYNQKLTPDMSIEKNFLDDLLFLKYRISYNFISRSISNVAENICCQFFGIKVVQKTNFPKLKNLPLFENTWKSMSDSPCIIPCNYFFKEIFIPNDSQ